MPHPLVLDVLANAANPTPQLWRIATKVTYFIGLIGVTGVSMLYLLVVRPILRRPSVDPRDHAVIHRRAALFLAILGTWFLATLYFQLAGKAARVKGAEIPYGDALMPHSVWHFISVPAEDGEWISTGVLTLVQYLLSAAAAVALMALWSARARQRTAGVALTALILVFAGQQVTLLPTDFSKEAGFDFLSLLMNHVHVFAISTWVGGITGLVALATTRGQLTQNAGTTWAQLWTRFSTVALTAVGCVLISGLFLSWTLVGNPRELFTTSFGGYLLVKVSLVLSMILVGAVNEFVLMPRIARARAAGQEGSVFRLAVTTFPLLVGIEVVLALGVLFALSFLTGSARIEAKDPDPALDGGIIGIGVLMAAILAASFVGTAKLSGRMSRPRGPAESAELDATRVSP